MRTSSKLLAALSVLLVAASHDTSMEVVKADASGHMVGVLFVLTTVTSLTFILILLACGMRNPIL